jgi:hypothetical protein
MLFVWIRISDIIPAWREASKNPDIVKNMETVADAMIEEEKRRGSYDAFRNMVRGMRP